MATVVYVYVTRCRRVSNTFSPFGHASDVFIDIPNDDTVAFTINGQEFGAGLTITTVNIVDIDGHDRTTTDWYPVVPGGTLTDVRPWVSAYLTDASQIPWTGGPVGTFPEPTLKPWWYMDSTEALMFEDFGTTPSPPKTICGAADDLSAGPFWADTLQLGAWDPYPTLNVTGFGYQLTYDVAGGEVPPQRIFQRDDAKTHGGKRIFGQRSPSRIIQTPL